MGRKPKKDKVSKPWAIRRWWRGLDEPARSAVKRRLAVGCVVAAVAAAAVVGMKLLERGVLSRRSRTAPVKVGVRLSGCPGWMSPKLAHEIGSALRPDGADFYDPALAETAHRLASSHPWIARVRGVAKRRTADARVAVVEVEADFRTPVAKVRLGPRYAYVDAEGVRLPADQVPAFVAAAPDDPAPAAAARANVCYADRSEIPPGRRFRPIHYILIDGVAAPPPPVGQPWHGADLAEGLRLVRLVRNRSYANQITVVDVRNHGGRINPDLPHLQMHAQIGRARPTCIRFGRFPRPGGDYVVSPERKLKYIESYVADHGGQLAGINRYLDLRYDELHVSIN